MGEGLRGGFLDEARRVAETRSRPPGTPGASLVQAIKKAVAQRRVGLILEYKRCSPRGFTSYLTPPEFLERVRGLADAISVLVEPYWFCGSPELIPIMSPVAPVLAKDLVYTGAQLKTHARWGASASLLILEMLGWRRMEELYQVAVNLGLEVLIETNSPEAVLELMHSYPGVPVGLNSRDLSTLRVDFNKFLESLERVSGNRPSSSLLVAESGVDSEERLRRVVEKGVDALLIGTWVMRDLGSRNALATLRSQWSLNRPV